LKNVLAWCKAHLLVVICSALVLIIVPTAFVLSSIWNKSIHTKRQAEVEAALTKVKISTAYALPSLDPSIPAVTLTDAPNEQVTKFFKAEKEKILAQAAGVVKKAEVFNRRGHRALMEGLLPGGRGPDAQAKARAFAEMLVGGPGTPAAYQALFQEIKAGEPRDPNLLATVLGDAYMRLKIAKTGEGSSARALTPEESVEITKALKEIRLGQYQGRARELSVYAGTGVLGNNILLAVPKAPPSNSEVFAWQADYWLIDDLLKAVAAANTMGGRSTTIDSLDPASGSVVKRIQQITFERAVWQPKASTGNEPLATEEAADAAAPADAQLTPDFKQSISGRFSGPSNGVYDIRYAYMSMVVSSGRLPQFFDAVARTNFMTIVDVDLKEADVYGDLERGYYYGDEPVVVAMVAIEAVYLRSWTTPYMPSEVKKHLGVAEPASAEGAASEGEGGKK